MTYVDIEVVIGSDEDTMLRKQAESGKPTSIIIIMTAKGTRGAVLDRYVERVDELSPGHYRFIINSMPEA